MGVGPTPDSGTAEYPRVGTVGGFWKDTLPDEKPQPVEQIVLDQLDAARRQAEENKRRARFLGGCTGE